MAWDDAAARAGLRRLFEAGLAAADPLTVLAGHLPAPPAGPGDRHRRRQGGGQDGAGGGAGLAGGAAVAGWSSPPMGRMSRTRRRAGGSRCASAAIRCRMRPGRRRRRRCSGCCAGWRRRIWCCSWSRAAAPRSRPCRPRGSSLDDLMAVNRELLRSGAPIQEMNCIRKHLSGFSGGRVAVAAHPARVVTLAISDVPGDDPAVIASGPTVPDPTSFAEARALVAHYRMELPPAVVRHLAAAAEESPKPGDPRLRGHRPPDDRHADAVPAGHGGGGQGAGPGAADPRRCAGGRGRGAGQGAGRRCAQRGGAWAAARAALRAALGRRDHRDPAERRRRPGRAEHGGAARPGAGAGGACGDLGADGRYRRDRRQVRCRRRDRHAGYPGAGEGGWGWTRGRCWRGTTATGSSPRWATCW